MCGLGMKNLGGVFNLEWVDLVDNSDVVYEIVVFYDGCYNCFFLGGVFKKFYFEIVLVGLEFYLLKGW